MNEQQEIIQTLITIRDWCRYGASLFSKAKLFYGHGTDNAWDEAVALVLHALCLSYEFGEKILDSRLLTNEKQAIYNLFQQRVITRQPVPYLINKAYYGGLEFYVDKRVLIPRSPIQELIEKQFSPWVDADSVEKILDIGTGSACLPILAAHYFPFAEITAVDIDLEALDVAKINLKRYALTEQIHLIHSDLFSEIPNDGYDIIISNPPYVDADDMADLPKEFLHEPRHALASGEKGLDHILEILQKAPQFLNKNGILIAEVGNSALALEKARPDLDFTWLEFERGGSGVFLLTYEQLMMAQNNER